MISVSVWRSHFDGANTLVRIMFSQAIGNPSESAFWKNGFGNRRPTPSRRTRPNTVPFRRRSLPGHFFRLIALVAAAAPHSMTELFGDASGVDGHVARGALWELIGSQDFCSRLRKASLGTRTNGWAAGCSFDF